MEEDFFTRISAFEWDDNKRRANIAKHGVDFVDAAEVFADPKQYTYRSARHAGEERYVSVGMSKGTLIAVVFTRRETRLRIISARTARKSERERYG
jgi:hypothetical protein